LKALNDEKTNLEKTLNKTKSDAEAKQAELTKKAESLSNSLETATSASGDKEKELLEAQKKLQGELDAK